MRGEVSLFTNNKLFRMEQLPGTAAGAEELFKCILHTDTAYAVLFASS